MSSQLEQLLGYLERNGVTEVVVGSGRPIAMRTARGLTNLTARPLSTDQVATLVRGTQLAALVPAQDGDGARVEISVGRRRAMAQASRRAGQISISLTRLGSEPAPAIATLPLARVATPDAAPKITLRTPSAQRARSDAVASVLAPPLALDDGPYAEASPAATAVGNDSPALAIASLDLDASAPLELDVPGAMFAPAPHAPATTSAASTNAVARAVTAASATIARTAAPATPMAPASAPALAARELARADSGAFASLVRAARDRGASDLHVSAARVTAVRVAGELVPLVPDAAPLSATAAEELLLPLLEPTLRARLDEIGYVDLALAAPGGGRLRANISRQQQGLKGTFRIALPAPATLDELGLPAELAKVVAHHQGLVVIAGPSGHGKTTTLAALVDLLNSSRPYHILTIEDPVEIEHPRKQAVISQRETGRHTQSFARGLKASLREDPDVIVIGELRDRESVEIALTAAETGHLVLATMSTPSAAKTIDRLIDMFPPEEHGQVRASIAGALRAIVAQRLLPRRGGGVVPAIELVTGVLPLAVLIRDDKLYQLPNLLQRGRAFGMIRFDESLAEHVRAGRLDEDVALGAAENQRELATVLRPPAASPATQAKTSPLWGFGKKKEHR